MKELKLTLFILCFFTLLSSAQPPYVNAVGIRAGYSSGLEFKHFISSDFALDAKALYNKHGFQLSVLYDYQFSPYGKERLQYYAGLGVHGGNWADESGIGETAIGAVAVVGGEFIFRKAPVILGLEWKPMINIIKTFDYVIPDIALTFNLMLN